MKKRVLYVTSTLALLALMLSACGAAPAREDPPLRVGWIAWGGFYPLVIGHEKGFFEKHGVEVEPIFYEQYNAGLADFRSGKLDGMTMAIGDATLIEGLSPGNVRFPLLTDDAMESEGIIVSPDILTVKDLEGKRVGCRLGSYGELFLRRVLVINNIEIDSVEFLNVAPENVPDALARGEIQAGHAWEPILSEARQSGNRILYRASDFPGLVTDGVAIRSHILEERLEDVKAFQSAWFETLEWWAANPEEGAGIAAKYAGLTPSDISTEGIRLFMRDENVAAFRPGTDTTSIYFTAGLFRDFFIESGLITQPPDVDKMLGPSFLQ